MATPIKKACDACHQNFKPNDAVVRTKECGHEVHKTCFDSVGKVRLIEGLSIPALCPGKDGAGKACKKHIAGYKGNPSIATINSKVEFIVPKPDIPTPNPAPTPQAPAPTPQAPQSPKVPTPAPKDVKETRGIRYVAYLAVALLCMTVAGVIWPSFIAIGIGAAAAVPIGYLVGKGIERYHAS